MEVPLKMAIRPRRPVFSYSSHSLPLPEILLAGSSFIMLSASPTCFLSETSRFLSFERILAMLAFVKLPNANPWDEADNMLPPSLMTAGCHCSGSEELDNLFKWRYTSVPYLQVKISKSLHPSSRHDLPLHRNELQITSEISRVEP